MSDLICRNTMMRCQTPGMCSPHGGCRETEPVSSVWLEQLRSEFRAAVRERDALKAECEGLRKDAERYRLIRDSDEVFIRYTDGQDIHLIRDPEQLDAMADLAISQEVDHG